MSLFSGSCGYEFHKPSVACGYRSVFSISLFKRSSGYEFHKPSVACWSQSVFSISLFSRPSDHKFHKPSVCESQSAAEIRSLPHPHQAWICDVFHEAWGVDMYALSCLWILASSRISAVPSDHESHYVLSCLWIHGQFSVYQSHNKCAQADLSFFFFFF